MKVFIGQTDFEWTTQRKYTV